MVFKKPGNGRDDKPQGQTGRSARSGDGAKRNSSDSRSSSSPKFNKDFNDSPRRGRKPSDGTGERSFGSSKGRSSEGEGSERNFSRQGGEKPARNTGKSFGDRPVRKTSDKPYGERSDKRSDKPFGEKKFGTRSQGGKPAFGKSDQGSKRFGSRPSSDRTEKSGENFGKPYKKSYDRPERTSRSTEGFDENDKPARTLRPKKSTAAASKDDHLIRLNRYISNAGICSRRKADELIMAGVVSVNGEVVSELGHKVDPNKDVIRYNGETLKREKMVYVLLNKPKDYITTTDDPQERRTVMHLVDKASKERIYPVGRLDRNTTGLLLMTNDGDLADKLSHPRNNITKIYQVELNKSLTQGDMNKIGFGVELEDGFIKPDTIAYVQGGTKREVGIQIHSGRNRIVRRIFEHLGYEVEKLDRSVYANLTKKDLPRGRWRFLEEKEVIQLKNLVK